VSDAGGDLAIEVRGLSKVFRLYDRPTDVLIELFLGRQRARESCALTDISLVVRTGETLGIVGRNGAGKSTLLKIIAGTLVPTTGTVAVHGRIAAILELGSGFNPEFTGRENVYMGGLVLGLSRAEIDARFDDIVEFSGLRDFIDQPVRTYSTGMQARLSFSVATSVDPDIMIVDEALSVGDARFQLKCFERFEEMRRAGKTVLLVSHNMVTVTTLCDRAILVEGGRIIDAGEPRHIDMSYHRLLFGGTKPDTPNQGGQVDVEPAVTTDATDPPLSRFGSGAARITETGLFAADGLPSTLLPSGKPCRFVMLYTVYEPIDSVVAGIVIRTPRGVDLFGVDTATDGSDVLPTPELGETVRVEFECTMWLAAGEYFVTFALARADGHKFDARYDDLLFRIDGTDRLFTTSIVNLDHRISAVRMTSPPSGDAGSA
jgi:ABC-type polysaccharide/polyol phosphate transport system ATPase subunit